MAARYVHVGTAVAFVLTMQLACSGSIAEEGAAPSTGTGGAGDREGPAGRSGGSAGQAPRDDNGCSLPGRRIRQLTPEQIDNTLAALAPELKLAAALDFPRPGRGGNGFSNDSDRLTLSLGDVEKQFGVATAWAEAAAAAPERLESCLGKGLDPSCVRAFVKRFVARAFRRPLREDETDGLVTFVAEARTRHGDTTALVQLLRRVLMSPHFLFRSELGQVQGDVAELDAFERAAALAYTLTDGPPDDVLWQAAETGALDDEAGMRAAAVRLLDQANAAGVTRLFSEWLRIDAIAGLVKDDVYPGFSSQIARDMKDAVAAFVTQVVWRDDGRLTGLLAAPYAMANDRLVSFLGWDASAGDAFAELTFGDEPRAGILGQPGLLALLAHAGQTDPIRRGRFVRELFLCEAVPPPPPTVDAVPPPPEGDLTLREKLQIHADDPSCATCHAQMDDIGFALERFDGVGRHRTMDNGKPIDARGRITGSASSDGAFDGAAELARHLAASAQVHACFVRQGFRYVFGRSESEADGCELDRLSERFAAKDTDIRALLVELAASPGFSRRGASFD